MFDALPIFQFLASNQRQGNRVVLVTIVGVSGGSTRNPGTHMAVCEDESFTGTLSGGCIERAVVAEALDVLQAQAPRIVRYGAGSPYIDIRLPCGGWIDVHFMPLGEPSCAQEALSMLESRAPCRLRIGKDQPNVHVEPGSGQSGIKDMQEEYWVDHSPSLRMHIYGTGDAVLKLAQLASQIAIGPTIATPDEGLYQRSCAADINSTMLQQLDHSIAANLDHWSAAIFMFHDHDWETQLIHQAITSEAFYVGAMGSKATHEARKDKLLQAGATQEQVDAISAPIGVIHSMRDPETLAVSVLAQVIDCYNRAFLS